MMDIFIQPLFWIFMGVCYTMMVLSAQYWAYDLGVDMNRWRWLLAGVWFVFLSLSLAGGMTLIGEGEQLAGLYFLGFFLLLALLMGVGLWRWWTGNKKDAGQ